MVRAGLRSGALALLLLGQACASSPAPEPPLSARAITARRVTDILEQRHVTHLRLDDRVSARVFDALLQRLDPDTACAAHRAELQAQRLRLDDALRAGNFGAAREASRLCAGHAASGTDAEALLLGALAKAYDPHSAFLSPAQLAALRAEIHAPPSPEREARGRLVNHDGAHIAWIVLPSVYLHDRRSASRDVHAIMLQLATFQGADITLLDLRGNGGGVIEEAVRLLGVFVHDGPLASELRSDGSAKVLIARAPAESYYGPLVVLVDAATASVAEVFAGAIQDRARGVVIGQRTQGKGSGQTLVLLSSPTGAPAGAVNVSDRLFYRLDGQPLQRLGVTPDIELAADGATVQTERERASALTASPLAPQQPGPQRLDPALVRALRERAAATADATSEQRVLDVAAAYLRAWNASALVPNRQGAAERQTTGHFSLASYGVLAVRPF